MTQDDYDDDTIITSADDSSLSYSYSFPGIVGSGTIGVTNFSGTNFSSSLPVSIPIFSGDGVTVTSTETIKNKMVMKMKTSQNDVIINFYGNDGDTLLSALLSPESNMTPVESMRINLLVIGAQNIQGFEPIEYIKKHNLERHFTFSIENE